MAAEEEQKPAEKKEPSPDPKQETQIPWADRDFEPIKSVRKQRKRDG